MNNETGFYLLLDLGLPIGLTSWPSDIYCKTFTLPGLKTKVQLVYLWDRASIPRKTTIPRGHGISHSIQDSGRFVFWLRNNKRDDAFAQQITDAVWAILTVLHSVPGPAGHTPAALWLPADILRDNLFVKVVDILVVEKQKPPEERVTIASLDMVKARLDTCSRFLFSVMDDMWRTLPGVLKNPPLFDALHFFQASLREYSFLGDSIGEVLEDKLHGPVSRFDSTRAENAIINAFKAIEAIIGDPPKDDARFETKLREAYIDPAKPFGYRRTDPSEPIF
ncbi:MAG: hypothetical protein M3Z35_06245 [Nitrospirota bacterium]|nr:hypothetical protein [Nitrospirota bacterium]